MKNFKMETLFSVLLKRAGLTIKRFSEITGTPYRTVQDWNLKKRTPNIAIVFLKLYIKLKNYYFVLCPFCDTTFLIEKKVLNENFCCPYCKRTKEEAKEQVDELTF